MNKYLTILEDAWKDHLKPRADDAPTVISLFSGCGGSSLGYSMAGFKELLAVEWDDNAVETFKLNFPGVPVFHGDIAKCEVDWILQETGLQPGQLDILDGSPPCQGFSTAGKRILDDPRNQLFREFVRILRGLQPKVFVMENVSGMVKGSMKLVFADILRELKTSGYFVSARLLKASYYLVPQSRQRMIFVGVRQDLVINPSHPTAENSPVVVRDAIGDLCDKDLPELLHVRHYRGKDTKSFKNWLVTKHGDPVLGQSLYKIDPMKPCNTIKKSSELFHYSENRILTAREYARLSSFPDGFRFIDDNSAHKRIGNSAPPLFMRSIARHIRQEILEHDRQ